MTSDRRKAGAVSAGLSNIGQTAGPPKGGLPESNSGPVQTGFRFMARGVCDVSLACKEGLSHTARMILTLFRTALNVSRKNSSLERSNNELPESS